MPDIADRVITRRLTIDLALEAEIKPLAKRRYKAQRQDIVQFAGREGSVERFDIRQTVPYCGYEVPNPPSPAQHRAVMDYFLEACETPYQASTMLSARDYADEVARYFSYAGFRRHLISISTAAFILSDRKTRGLVRSLNISSRASNLPSFSRRSTHAGCYTSVVTFAEKLVADMRGAGAEVFG